VTADELRAALEGHLDPTARTWLDSAVAAVAHDAPAVRTLFPAARRHVGRAVIADAPAGDPAPWTADDAARALLLVALNEHADAEVPDLYRYGDADEQRAIVRSLHLLCVDRNGGRRLLLDAIRTNDPRLIRVALGPHGVAELDDEEVAQAALKCVFVGVPLTCIDGLENRATPRLARMLAEFALERVAAGRIVPPDVWPFVERHPPNDVLARIAEEVQHPVDDRREAAQAALEQRAAATQEQR
jgi:hypothetical protein